MQTKIRSVEKVKGEVCIFYTTDHEATENRVDEIKEEFKEVDKQGGGFMVYRGYKNGKPTFEMGVTPEITVIYGEPVPKPTPSNSKYL